ncbi:MAG: TonB-dependent receptor plug domain-containing protein, partial [Spirochaetota bacterium]
AGSYNTFRESLTVNGGSDDAHYSFGIARIDTKGFSTAARESGTSGHMDKDGYTNITFSGRTGYRITDSTWLTHVLRYTDADAELDDGAYYDDPNYTQSSKQISSALSLDQELFRWWEHKIILSYMNIERRYEDKTDDAEPSEFTKSWYEGTHHKAEWQHIFSIGDVDEITMGAEIQENSTTSTTYSDIGFGASTDQFDERDIWEGAAYIQNHLKLMDRIFAIAGIRYNDHETFGNEITYGLSGSIIFPLIETRLKGNYATGFRAPVMTQIYDTAYTTGNPDLKPETSTTWDVGISQPLLNEKIRIETTYFEAEYRDKIESNGVMPKSQYINKDKIVTKGIECALLLSPIGTFTINAAYTYLSTAEDRETEERLYRRPRHQGSLHANWKFLPGGNLNLGINYMGKRDDAWYDESISDTRDVEMNEYYTIDISASYWLLESVQVFGRVENMLDEDYQFPIGYNTPGRSYYAGLKAVL